MIFISLFKWKKKPTKDVLDEFEKRSDDLIKEYGIKSIGRYWVMGRYDSVGIFDAPDVATMMKFNVARSDTLDPETLVAIPREDILKMLG